MPTTAPDRTCGCWNADLPDLVSGRPLMLVVAAVLVDADGRVLLAQRPTGKSMAGLWEFPGGKIEDGEPPERALIRELVEELGIETRPGCLSPLTFASHAYESFHLLMPVFLIRSWRGTLRGREGQSLAWVTPNRLRDYAMPPADLPLIAAIQDAL
ncbi:MAG: (deoxy)nucleoside triphosphate pyrophosphohydrolase [Rhodospirillaceae bacterium]|nr:(deoxy)nucleoside triphosphate pyrophosphohydrolase [Rhodospirillaceae bacterium]